MSTLTVILLAWSSQTLDVAAWAAIAFKVFLNANFWSMHMSLFVHSKENQPLASKAPVAAEKQQVCEQVRP